MRTATMACTYDMIYAVMEGKLLLLVRMIAMIATSAIALKHHHKSNRVSLRKGRGETLPKIYR
jgi:hypothetical protein